MKWLTINCTKQPASFLVVEDAGQRVGNLQLLDWQDLPAIARWLGIVGGRDLLDSFEIALINDGLLRVWPVNDEGEPHPEDCTCIALEHHDDGIRLFWNHKVPCPQCAGRGHHAPVGQAVEEEDSCTYCDGDGRVWGHEVMTDQDGNVVTTAEVH